jgi:hypothetical protein
MAALVGCAGGTTGDLAALDGLMVLTADAAGGAGLSIWTSDGDGPPSPVPVALPAPATAWVAGGRDGILAATLFDGSLHGSDGVVPGGSLDWRPIDARDLTGDAPPGPAWFVTWDPEGGRLATIAGDLPGGAEVELLLIDPSTESAHAIELGRSLLPSPPAWLDGERVALVAGSTLAPVSIIVDTTTGEVAAGPGGDLRLVTSADGAVLAATGAPDAPVVVRSTSDWLAGASATLGSIAAPRTGALATSLALDADGSRLAIVWQGVDRGPRIDVHDASDGWRRVTTLATDADTRAAMVAWSR